MQPSIDRTGSAGYQEQNRTISSSSGSYRHG